MTNNSWNLNYEGAQQLPGDILDGIHLNLSK